MEIVLKYFREMKKKRFFSNLIKEIEIKWKETTLAFPQKKSSGKKSYILAQFPYPSGNLHMGHVRVYTAADALARTRRLQGYDVLNPMGWDAFGLPAENAARERGIDPAIWTYKNIEQMRKQFQNLAIQINWEDHEINTCNLDYYRWTRWIFARLFKRGLAYRREAQVNWDPVDQTVLADEQVSPEGTAWRSGAKVEKRNLPQWFLKITNFKEELLKGLDELPEWPDGVKEMQRNWITGMRDWLISRQRKWGTPIPIIHCHECGPQLTISDDGSELKDTLSCPCCGSPRVTSENDTMDTFMDSSWYYLRFLDSKNQKNLVDPQKISDWMPVDIYIGGIEHAIMHLLYARFIYKFLLQELGTKENNLPEPFKLLVCQGLVMGKTLRCPDSLAYLKPDQVSFDSSGLFYKMKSTGKQALLSWEKMSKSKYNGVDPSDVINEFGCDVLRLSILFKAPIKNTFYWDEHDLVGVNRWFNRLLNMKISNGIQSETSRKLVSRARQQVTGDLENNRCNFHTAIAALMKLSNEFDAIGGFDADSLEQFSIMLYPMAPHLAAELFSRCNTAKTINEAVWPRGEVNKNMKNGFVNVQLDGKTIGEVEFYPDWQMLVNNAIEKFSLNPSLNHRMLNEKGILSFTSRKLKN
jgi:leucyl-tRNA synthetase